MHLFIGIPGGTEWVLIVLILLLPALALIDITRATFNDPVNKIVWVIVVLLLPFLGPILYFLIGRRQKVIQ